MYLISTIQKPPENYWLRGLAFIDQGPDCAETVMRPLSRALLLPLLLSTPELNVSSPFS